MATVTATPSIPSATKVPITTWTGLSTGDTATAIVVPNQTGLAAGIQMSGTWGGATVVLQGSMDGSTYFTLKDVTGASISATANAYFEFSTSAIYLKPSSSGGAADDVNLVLALRGPASNV